MRQTALNAVHGLAKRDERVLFIGSDLGAGVLAGMKAETPDRFFMEGIAEQHVIGMAAGLAMEGFIPYINTIATFLTRRCYEQLAIDVCLDNLPVRLLASGGGAVYAPLGPTHIALDDLALLRVLPNMTVVAPCDAEEMKRVMEASLDLAGPLYVRFAKGGDKVVSRPENGFAFGRGIEMRKGADVLFVGTGVATTAALEAAEILAGEGVNAGVLHLHTVKPLDIEAVADLSVSARLVATVEEHSRIGGLGSAVIEGLNDIGLVRRVLRLAFEDRFAEGYGSQAHLLAKAGLDGPSIARRTLAALEGRSAAP
jgi:transketolase